MSREQTAGSVAFEILEEEEEKPALSLEDLVAPSEERGTEPGHPPGATEVSSEASSARAPATVSPGLRTARVLAADGRRAKISFRGSREVVDAQLAPDVEADLIADAAAHGDSVLVEVEPGGEVVVVGLVQTRRAREVRVTGEKIVIEGEREVLIRAGRAALRLREDGDVELVGSRISAASRGLFRIVGRILRLN